MITGKELVGNLREWEELVVTCMKLVGNWWELGRTGGILEELVGTGENWWEWRGTGGDAGLIN